MNNNMGFDFDSLFCNEEDLDGVLGSETGFDDYNQNVVNEKGSIFISENELDWHDDELISLISKEKVAFFGYKELISNDFMTAYRKIAVDWISGVISYYGFSALTSVLAMNYFDQFISSVSFQKEKPWMAQLVAIACLSLAAKVEETRVPLLLDLQVGETRYFFEAKTIMKAELMVLSALKWKMHPVTPLSFVDYVIRRLEMKTHLRSIFLARCEGILLSAISDPKVGSYLPSVLAAGIMLHSFKEVELDNVSDCQSEVLNVLELSMDKVEDVYKFILDLQASHDHDKNLTRKRKYPSVPSSPSGVIDAYFSSDSSNDSWFVAPLVMSSPESAFKRSGSNDQQMRWRL